MQHAARGLVQRNARRVKRRQVHGAPFHAARHFRRFAQQGLHGQIDGGVLEMTVGDQQAAIVRGFAEHGKRATLARTQGAEVFQPLGGNGQHVTFLRFVAPDFARTHAGFFAGHFAQFKMRPQSGSIRQFRHGVGQAARAHVVNREDGIARALTPAGVDDFLRAALDFRIAALHGGKIQLGGVFPRAHAGSRAAAQPDEHPGAAQLHQQCAGGEIAFVRLAGGNVAQPASNHDGLVIAAHLLHDFLRVGAEIAGKIRAAKFVVERRAAQRPIHHDLQGAGHVRRRRLAVFPRLRQRGQVEVGDGKAGQPRLGFGAAPRGTFIADFAARAGGRARKGRNRCGVIVGFHLGEKMQRLFVLAPVAVGVGIPGGDLLPFQNGGVVRIGDHGACGRGGVGFANHAEETVRLRLVVDNPVGVEDFVAAVLGIGLREHGQFGVRRVAPAVLIVRQQVIEFVFRERQPQRAVGLFQRRAPVFPHGNAAQRGGRIVVKQAFGFLHVQQQGFGHAVKERRGSRGEHIIRRTLASRLHVQVQRAPALNAQNFRKTALARNFGRLRRPRRNGAKTRRDPQRDVALRFPVKIARIEQRVQAHPRVFIQRLRQFDEIKPFRVQPLQPRQCGQCGANHAVEPRDRKRGMSAQNEQVILFHERRAPPCKRICEFYLPVCPVALPAPKKAVAQNKTRAPICARVCEKKPSCRLLAAMRSAGGTENVWRGNRRSQTARRRRTAAGRSTAPRRRRGGATGRGGGILVRRRRSCVAGIAVAVTEFVAPHEFAFNGGTAFHLQLTVDDVARDFRARLQF